MPQALLARITAAEDDDETVTSDLVRISKVFSLLIEPGYHGSFSLVLYFSWRDSHLESSHMFLLKPFSYKLLNLHVEMASCLHLSSCFHT